MRKKLLLIIMITTWHFLSAQNEHKVRIPNIVSPQAYQMLKYTETPVSYASGLPQISIPIYNYKKDDINLNLSLSYHAKGIKVNEIATPFGLGWNLNGLGEITRNVRGLKDETPYNGYIYTDKKVAAATPTTINSSMNGVKVDYEPDLFNIMLPNGKSVQFMFAQNLQNNTNNIITFPLSDIKIISPFSQEVNYWQVIDTDGTIYYFGENNANDGSQMKYYDYDPENGSLPAEDIQQYDYAVTSWKLTKIKTISNNYIYFNYRSEMYNQSNHCYNNTMSSNMRLVNNLHIENNTSYSLTGTEGKNSVIDNIISDNIKIVFSKGSLRSDLKYSNLINSIDIYAYNVLQNQVKFNFSYFNSTDNYVTMLYGCGRGLDMDELSKRLKLDNVVYNDKQLNKVNSYSLEYNTAVNLPNRNSFAQDYWGYYNGQKNRNLVPNIILDPKYLGEYGIQINHHRRTGANRSINPNYTQANMLKKIIYPTGGYTIFKFENNKTSYKRDSLDLSIMDAADTVNVSASALDYETTSQNSMYYIFKKKLILPQTFIKYWGIDYISKAGECEPMDTNGNYNIDCSRFNIYDLNTNAYVFPIDKTLGIDNYLLDLNPGNYEIHIKVKKQEYDYYINNNLAIPDWSIEMRYLIKKELDSYHFGGLRIQEITTYDSNNNLTLKKVYSYVRPDKPNLSSGYFYSYPNHLEIKEGKYAVYGSSNACALSYFLDGYLLNFSASSYFPLIDLGNYITYTDVEEKEVNAITNETIYHKYNYSFVEPYFYFPNEPQSRQWESSNLRNYNSVNMSKSNLYDYHSVVKSVKGIDTSSLNFYTKPTPAYNCSADIILVDSKSINPVGGKYELFTNYYFTQKEEVTQDNMKTKTEYFYNNPSHYQLTTQKTTFPDFSTQTTEYQYAHEKGNSYLTGKNMVGIPLQTMTYESDILKPISKTETIYPTSQTDADNKTSGLPLPVSVSSLDLKTNAMDTQVVYNQYDNKGNIQQYTLNPDANGNGTPVTIIWGYNQTQPIAKIEGATYAQVSGSISDIVTSSNTDAMQGTATSEQDLIDKLNVFRKAFPNYQITTYTYNPLIGVTSITPPNGIREIYKYDTANRLESVKDSNGNLLKEYQYHYKP